MIRPDRGLSENPPEEDLRQALTTRLRGKVVVVGIGNPRRGDDAVGSLVARLLWQAGCRGPSSPLRVIDAEEIPEAYLEVITRPAPDTVVLVDAVNLGHRPGTAALLEMEDVAGREVFTHNAPLTLLARFIRAETGADVCLLGIQPGRRQVGTPPGREVRRAASSVARLLAEAGRRPC